MTDEEKPAAGERDGLSDGVQFSPEHPQNSAAEDSPQRVDQAATATPQPPAAPRDPPLELRDIPAWLLWRYEQHPGEPKPRKIPYYLDGRKRHGRQGSPEDRARLVTFAAARSAAARGNYEGVGIALLPGMGITALDFDHVVGPDGAIPPEVMAVIGDTYAEFSPSGTGLRAFVKGDLGNHKSTSAPGQPWGVEFFGSSGYCTFTGLPYWTTDAFDNAETIAPISPALEALATARFGPTRSPNGCDPTSDPFETFTPRLGVPAAEIEAMLADLDPSMGRDGWIRVGMALHHETGGEGFALWDAWSSGGAQYPGTDALEAQWLSFDRPSSRQPVTMASVKKMVAVARAAKGLPPQTFDPISRVVEDAQAALSQVTDGSVVATPEDYGGRYPIISMGEFSRRRLPPWIIKGVVPDADLGVIFGQSGSGKSFFVIDMALAIARGIPWRGRKVNQRRVQYLAAEGAGGVAVRLRAYAEARHIDVNVTPLGVLSAVPNFLIESDVAEVVEAILAAGGAHLIIVDTLAQVTPGANENAGEDMGLALRHARRIKDATGAMVLLVHHSGKDASKGARGWSGLKAAADVEIEIRREQEARWATVTKLKDGGDAIEFRFRLDPVDLGIDDDDDHITSMVVEHMDTPEGGRSRPKPRGENQLIVFEAVQQLQASSGGRVRESAVIEYALAVKPLDTGPDREPPRRDNRRSNLERALGDLVRKGVLFREGGEVSTSPIAADETGEV
ncbi:AAA family ATPase [Phenylobacterium sp.]|uniref:AAA family ATPase n=1 Tax=Phenylobacterium sp. TaxID=1871053 RepID=UPI00374CC99B